MTQLSFLQHLLLNILITFNCYNADKVRHNRTSIAVATCLRTSLNLCTDDFEMQILQNVSLRFYVNLILCFSSCGVTLGF